VTWKANPATSSKVAIESLENGYGETRVVARQSEALAAWHALEEGTGEGYGRQRCHQRQGQRWLTVMIDGIRAFLPGSLVDIRPVKGHHSFMKTRR